MVWGVTSWRSLGPLVLLCGRSLSQHSGASVFPRARSFFQDDNPPINRWVREWLEEHDDETEHVPCPPQSYDLSVGIFRVQNPRSISTAAQCVISTI
ncbi:hypothetical protein AVEN_180830-1 [Araneus ventricosus]|uniref:Uncharacterized protein n=1 Tax=Araneus ventricosus TaxID=182803 RepID=A0A4Y2V742_ARAVE|nr:hypothetical protein AVEN_180830-1 [Araneus ventricosus]